MKTALLVSSLALVVAPGCTENDISMYVQSFQKIDPNMMCIVAPGGGGNSVTSGLMDANVISTIPGARGYVVAAVVVNNLISSSTATTVNRNEIEVSGFDVELQAPPGGSLPALGPLASKFFAPSAAGAADPNGGKVVGFAEVVPTAYAATFGAAAAASPTGRITVIAHMRPVGTRADGTLTGGWVDFPVDICAGCLSGDFMNTTCPAAGYAKADVQSGGCLIGQDYAVTCCMEGTTPLCGPSVPQKAM